MNQIDLESLFRTKIDNMLTAASWVHTVMQLLELNGVSQIWSEKPGWYFWIADAPGVHHLELRACRTTGQGNSDDARTGLFSLKFYPYADNPAFERFSRQEQHIVRSDLFDETSTPRYECLESIPADLFTIATIEFTTRCDDAWSLFSIESLDVMRTRRTRSRDTIESCTNCEVERSVPAWELGYPLFDRLVSLHANHSKEKPARVLFATAPGFEHVRDSRDSFLCEAADSVQVLALYVLFVKNGVQPDGAVDQFIARELDKGQLRIDGDIRPCGCLQHGVTHPANMPGPNQHWWTLADADFKSELASTCGCR